MPIPLPKIELTDVDAIDVIEGRRPVNDDAVQRIAASMAAIGLRTPITVRYFGDRESIDGAQNSIILVAGAHRLAAAKKLGWKEIPAYTLYEEPDEQARLWEIAENLHRAELTAMERSENIAEWVKLTDRLSAQLAPKGPSKGQIGFGRPESGINAASRELGIERTEAQRSIKVAGLSDEAKAAARETGLDNNQTVLLKAAKADNDVAFLRTEHARRDAERQRKGAENLNCDTGHAPAIAGAEQFAAWIMAKADPLEVPTVLSWLEGTKPKDVMAALRKARGLVHYKKMVASIQAAPAQSEAPPFCPDTASADIAGAGWEMEI